jgi:hypothetical protein
MWRSRTREQGKLFFNIRDALSGMAARARR